MRDIDVWVFKTVAGKTVRRGGYTAAELADMEPDVPDEYDTRDEPEDNEDRGEQRDGTRDREPGR